MQWLLLECNKYFNGGYFMYLINIMFGSAKMVKRFRFAPIAEQGDEEFDKAVKAINEIYKTSGRYKTEKEVLEHFRSYGFVRTAI